MSSRINWAPYYEYAINAAIAGEAIDADWTGTLATDSVQLTAINEAVAAAGTAEKIEEVKAGLADGSIHVFDTANFTVGGETLTTPTLPTRATPRSSLTVTSTSPSSVLLRTSTSRSTASTCSTPLSKIFD